MLKIVFMGTPEFARDQLAALWENRIEKNWEIVGVVSQPDKPKGRGYQWIPTPVKVYAEEVGIPVYQPQTMRDDAFAETLRILDPSLIVVAAYGKILPPYILEYPTYGCINVHGSILPSYRGAAPIQRAIMDGCTETGITIMHMADGIDTGDIIDTCPVSILENEDFGSLYARMGKAGANLLVRVIPTLENGTAQRTAQDDAAASYAHKIEKSECALDFSHDAFSLQCQIRGLSPAPLGFAVLRHGTEEKTIKVVTAEVETRDGSFGPAGTVLSADAKAGYFSVACGNGILRITALIPEGKGKMQAGDFIRGRKIAVGDILYKKQE